VFCSVALFSLPQIHDVTLMSPRVQEPTVYLNGRPFVFRALETPFNNIDDYAGIDTSRIEAMEQQLKVQLMIPLHLLCMYRWYKCCRLRARACTLLLTVHRTTFWEKRN
jgi:inositol hexakisphosphate